jgi:glycosyltransferase involved in cell wall biosynthesis
LTIRQADVCLGIFGTSEKASRVIPNKVYQILASKKHLITADTPAIRELLKEGPCVHLVPPGDAKALASAILKIKTMKLHLDTNCKDQQIPTVGKIEVGEQFKNVIRNVLNNH